MIRRISRHLLARLASRMLDMSARAVGFLVGFLILAGGIGASIYQMDFAAASTGHFHHMVLQKRASPACTMDHDAVWMPGASGSRTGAETLLPKTLHRLLAKADFASVEYGHGPVKLLVLIDPACLPCRSLWHDLMSVRHWRSRFSIRLVPIDFVGSGLGEATRILTDHPKPDAIDFGASVAPGDKAGAIARNTKAWIAIARAAGARPGLPGIVVNQATLSIGRIEPGLIDALASPWPVKTHSSIAGATTQAGVEAVPLEQTAARQAANGS